MGLRGSPGRTLRDAAGAAARTAVSSLPTFRLVGAPPWAADVTVIVPTFERPRCLARLLESVRNHHPYLRVLVCDSSRRSLFDHGEQVDGGLTWYRLPRDLGHCVGAARNFLVDLVGTDYVFLSDDDHVFTASTDIARMHGFLTRRRYDIVAGAQGEGRYGAAVFVQRGSVVYELFHRHHGVVEPGVVRCDRTENVFLARTQALCRVRWNERLFASEHDEFFLRATRAGLRIAQMGDVHVGHDRNCETCSNRLWAVLRAVAPVHPDRGYRRAQIGSAGRLGRRTKGVRDLERTFCLESDGVTAVRQVRAPMRGRRLRRELESAAARR